MLIQLGKDLLKLVELSIGGFLITCQTAIFASVLYLLLG